MIGHMSLVKYQDKCFCDEAQVGMMVLDEERIWHFVSDTFSGKDDMGMKYGFKYSWWIGGNLPHEEITEIDNPAIDAMNQTIQIWLELAESGKNADWKRVTYGMKYVHGCPLCAYAESLHKETMRNCCKVCPMANHWGASMCDCAGATYNEWVHEDDPSQRKVKARAIVNEMIKVRAEMIANLTKEETVKQESYTEMKIKRVEIVEKTIENTLRLKLVKEDRDTILLAVDEDGCEIGGGCIVVIKEDGTLSRCPYINKGLGLQLDASGHIIE